jgi:tRNA-splicing ligase RtcB
MKHNMNYLNNLKKIGTNHWRLEKGGKRLADIDLFLSENLLKNLGTDESLSQLIDTSQLRGVLSPVVGMPDVHEGYGLPIGGVAAFDVKDGLISAGAVGYDINCGVRLLRTNMTAASLDKDLLYQLINKIEEKIPTGIGTRSHLEHQFSFERICHQGASVPIKEGYGWSEDLDSIEENGSLDNADLKAVSASAQNRGKNQLATLGGGNHFIEIQEIKEIYDENLATAFGLKRGNVSLMIHSGSRGFGHQICTDYTKILMKAARREKIFIPRSGLAAAPIDSREGQDYFAAMACAVNFAFTNRQLMASQVREAFGEIFKKDPRKDLEMETVYDVAHNIAKFEDFKGDQILLHRKGATRAFPKGHPMLEEKYKDTGHPAIVPGSMGTASYVMVGTEQAKQSWYSINHGAGRLMSRKEAKRKITEEEFEKSMKGIVYNTRNWRFLADEAPGAYKNIVEIVDTLVEAEIAKKVAKMTPLAVIKGAGIEG